MSQCSKRNWIFIGSLLISFASGSVAWAACETPQEKNSWGCVLLEHFYEAKDGQHIQRENLKFFMKTDLPDSDDLDSDGKRKKLGTNFWNTTKDKIVAEENQSFATALDKKALLQVAANGGCSKVNGKDQKQICYGIEKAVSDGGCDGTEDSSANRLVKLQRIASAKIMLSTIGKDVCRCISKRGDFSLSDAFVDSEGVSKEFLQECYLVPTLLSKKFPISEKNHDCNEQNGDVRKIENLKSLLGSISEVTQNSNEMVQANLRISNDILRQMNRYCRSADGMFRIPGSSSQVEKFSSAALKSKSKIPQTQDCTVLASALKESMAAIQPYSAETLRSMLEAFHNGEIEKLHQLYLPADLGKRVFMENLRRFMSEIVKNEGQTKMSSSNIGIILSGVVLKGVNVNDPQQLRNLSTTGPEVFAQFFKEFDPPKSPISSPKVVVKKRNSIDKFNQPVVVTTKEDSNPFDDHRSTEFFRPTPTTVHSGTRYRVELDNGTKYEGICSVKGLALRCETDTDGPKTISLGQVKIAPVEKEK